MVLTVADMQHHLRASGLDVPWLAELDPHDYRERHRHAACGQPATAVADRSGLELHVRRRLPPHALRRHRVAREGSADRGGRVVKLGCSSWSYHAAFRAGRIDLREWLRVCAEELELDGVELVDLHFPTTDPVYLRDIKKLCTDLQLTIARHRRQQRLRRRRPARARRRRRCSSGATSPRTWARRSCACSPAGCRRSAREPDPGRIVGALRQCSGSARRTRGASGPTSTWALRQCADYAAERGVVLALQNNRDDGIVGSAPQLEQCLHDVGSPWLRVCLDPADLRRPRGHRRRAAHASCRCTRACATSRDDGSDARSPLAGVAAHAEAGPLPRLRAASTTKAPKHPETAVPRAARYMRGAPAPARSASSSCSAPAPTRTARGNGDGRRRRRGRSAIAEAPVADDHPRRHLRPRAHALGHRRLSVARSSARTPTCARRSATRLGRDDLPDGRRRSSAPCATCSRGRRETYFTNGAAPRSAAVAHVDRPRLPRARARAGRGDCCARSRRRCSRRRSIA